MLFGFGYFLAASLGNIALLVFSLNRLYSLPLPHRLLRSLRLVHGLLALLGMVVFGGLFLAPSVAGLAWIGQSLGSTLLVGYAGVCGVISLIVLPVITLSRLRQRPAPALLSNHTRTVDVSAELGYKPRGSGKARVLTRLPGNEVFQVDLAERAIHLPQLPAGWDGLSILHLSDLHFRGSPDRRYFEHVMDLCRDWEPDLVALTGDIVDSSRHHRWIVPVLGRLRWRLGAFAVLGNHESWRDHNLIRRRLRRIGIRVLGNSWEQFEVLGQPLTIIGHEGPWFPPEPDVATCPTDNFRLLLSHTPDNIGWARQHGIDLMLAGHNHGGQIRFPVIGSVFSPSRYGRRFDSGIFHEPPTLLHVSRGLGGQQPVRYNCRPEVAKLVLRCCSNDSNLTVARPTE